VSNSCSCALLRLVLGLILHKCYKTQVYLGQILRAQAMYSSRHLPIVQNHVTCSLMCSRCGLASWPSFISNNFNDHFLILLFFRTYFAAIKNSFFIAIHFCPWYTLSPQQSHHCKLLLFFITNVLTLLRRHYDWPVKVRSTSQLSTDFGPIPAHRKNSAAIKTSFKINHFRKFLTQLRTIKPCLCLSI
jgi:hypothetical protein